MYLKINIYFRIYNKCQIRLDKSQFLLKLYFIFEKIGYLISDFLNFV